MIRILFLLTGKTFASGILPESRALHGKDIAGNDYIFDRFEFINNLQTIAALEKILPDGSILIRHVLNRNHPFKLWQQSHLLSKFLKDENITIVHQFWGGPAAFFMARKAGKIPFVLSLLGSDLMGAYTLDGRQKFKGKLLRQFSILAASQSSSIVVMSAVMKSALPALMQRKTIVLPEGIDVEKFFPISIAVARNYLQWSLTEKVILFFNNGTGVKNADLAYKAVDLLKQSLPNVCLLEVKNIAHQELVYYYNSADVLLITSLHEGSNNSLKEALACNCPVVSSNTGDAKERLEKVDPSVVIDGFEPAIYANALLDILQYPRRSNGEKAVLQLTTDFIAHQLLDLYKKLV